MFHRAMNYGELEVKPTVVITKDIVKRHLPKFKRHDDLIIIQKAAWEKFKAAMPLPVTFNENSPLSIDEDELACLVCQVIQKPVCRRVAIERKIENDDYRSPVIDLIFGDDGIVNHKENHILYQFDITTCMFSFGNINEKMRMANLDCSNEIVVDLFAGIGYFTLPLLIHAKAKYLYACEWNPNSIEALLHNLQLNNCDPAKCEVLPGDNREKRPVNKAQRVILGILPSCLSWMKTAFECIDKKTGAILHCHDLVESKPKDFTSNNNSQTMASPSDNDPDRSPQNSHTSTTAASQHQFNLSLQSSSSSQTVENMSQITSSSSLDDKTTSSESDKTTSSSPVFLEKPSDYTTSASSPDIGAERITDISSGSSLYFEAESMNESSPSVTELETDLYEAKAELLMAQIREDVEAHNLKMTLVQTKPIKSYAPHVTHVVFDIKIEPLGQPEDKLVLAFEDHSIVTKLDDVTLND